MTQDRIETKPATDTEPDSPEQHPEPVPEGAENMEHTLRRLTAEKEKKRARNPGLYL
ncbi:hypothetical protein CLV78_11034 [Aliiruegeria haliotis]|uniref:Uncharacterized protein n=1 Tax=Aliiruegeria haliotis TaxID=1280846 RepID=A0A2T0RJ46_9RHOB|nr:hypothetical protein [Aliiruegeria haliotis]PRY21161.1 hypothetical protein CLV78_11034 [Aliiruegeria haliotis]